MEALARLAVRRPVGVTVFAVTLVILGVFSWRRLPTDLLPDIQSPTVTVSVRSGDRPPLEMERVYGEDIERRLFSVEGVRRVDQTARSGRLLATATFEWNRDMDLALVDVQKAVNPVAADPDVDELLVRRFDPRQEPVLTLGVVDPGGRRDLFELRRLARRQIGPALERLPGVAEVRVLGGRDRQVVVDLDPARLESYGLTPAGVAQRLQAANLDVQAGTLEEGERVYLVRGLSRFRTPADVARAVIDYRREGSGAAVPVRTEDVGTVRLGEAPVRHQIRVNGVEGVSLEVYKEAGSNTVAVSRAVREALKALGEDLRGLEFHVASDEAGLVENAIEDLEGAALIGIGLAVLVLVFFLRSLGPTLVVSAAVPVSLLTTVLCMHLWGAGLNIMTLAGLALGAGMLVDNAIVVVESVVRRRGAHADPREDVVDGTVQVAGAIAASTLTTCAVFLPVLFVQGMAARLVEGLAFSVVVSLLASLAVAVLLIPALSGWFLAGERARPVDVGTSWFEAFVRRLLRHSAWVVLFATLASAGGIALLVRAGTELLPPADPRQFAVRLVGPPEQNVEATAMQVQGVESLLREAGGDGIETVLAQVGRLPEDDRVLVQEWTDENTARLLVRLRPDGPPSRALVERVAPAVASVARVEAEWDVGTSALARALGRRGPPVVVEIQGPVIDDLRRAAGDVRRVLSEREELWNVRSSFEGGPAELHVRLRRNLADALGMDLASVAPFLEAALDGHRATTLMLGDEEYDVVVRLPRAGLEALAEIPVRTPSGARLQLTSLAALEPTEGAREIFRRDQRRTARITARIQEGVAYPAALRAVKEALAEVSPPPGVRVRVAGEEEERRRTFGELNWAAGVAVLLLFMVLAGSFESLLHPFTVVASVPLALTGVGAVFGLTGTPVGVLAMLGIIVLGGVSVNDAILLVDAARRLVREGMDRDGALARAAAIRLRPILMTTLTTVLAMLPLALGTSETARLRQPLAVTLIVGLLASTAGSLLVIPCLYRLLESLRPRRRPS